MNGTSPADFRKYGKKLTFTVTFIHVYGQPLS